MNRLKAYTAAVVSVIFLLVSIMPAGSQETSGVVREGEPLHLYLKKDIVQNLDYLDFHPPNVDIIDDNRSYLMTLQQKGNPEDERILWFPRAKQSNFLQFEPNATLKFNYHFWIRALPPTDPTPADPVFKVNVKLEMDYERSGDFEADETLSFELSNRTGPEPQLLQGEVSLDINELEEFDGQKGGRLRVNISRQDTLSSIVQIYSGSQGRISWFQMPYSKYTYMGDEENGNNDSTYVIVILLIVVIVVVIGILFYKDSTARKEKERKEEEERKKKRRRRRR